MEFHFPDNVYVYLIIGGFLLLTLTSNISASENRSIFLISMFTSVFLVAWGFKGLFKIQKLKNRKKEAEINLLKKQKEEKSLTNEKLLTQLAEKDIGELKRSGPNIYYHS